MDSTKQQTTNSSASTQTGPYAPSVTGVQGLLTNLQPQASSSNIAPTAAETGALNGLMTNAQAGNKFAPQINSLATNLLNGGGPDRSGYTTDAYSGLQNSLSPLASQSVNPYDNQTFQNLQSTLSHDITDQIKSQYAGAGYSGVGTGDFAQQLGRGISQGVAPAFVDAQNNLAGQRTNAANSLYSAGANTTGILSGLDQTRLSNQLQGVQTSTDALNANDSSAMRQLQIAQMQRQLPLQNIGSVESLMLPLAQLGGTTNSQGTSTTNQTSNPGLLGGMQQVGSLFAGGANSAASGLSGAGLGLLGWL